MLPIVPVVLATGATGGRRRPLGVALGLALAFVVFTLTASRVLAALGLPQDLLHTIAVVLLAFAGLMLLVPSLAEWAGRLFQPLAARAGGRVPGGDGFGSGLLLGAALSVVWTPCAGPILAAVTALAAEHHVSGNLVLITIAYAAGATLPLFVLVLLGQRAAVGLRPGAPARPRAAARLRRRPPARRVAVHDQPADAAGGGDAWLSLLDPEPGARLRDQDRPARASTRRRRIRRRRWPRATRRTG